MFDIIIIALLSFFVLKKLVSILGEEHDSHHFNVNKKAKEIKEALVRNVEDENKQFEFFNYLNNNQKNLYLKNIYKKFNLPIDKFKINSCKAIEMLMNAYNQENIELLKMLMTKNLFSIFDNLIKENKKNNTKDFVTLVQIEDYKIDKIDLIDKKFIIEVIINTQQVHYTEDNNGNIISGNKNNYIKTLEKWTFTKDINNNENNWYVDAIEIL